MRLTLRSIRISIEIHRRKRTKKKRSKLKVLLIFLTLYSATTSSSKISTPRQADQLDRKVWAWKAKEIHLVPEIKRTRIFKVLEN